MSKHITPIQLMRIVDTLDPSTPKFKEDLRFILNHILMMVNAQNSDDGLDEWRDSTNRAMRAEKGIGSSTSVQIPASLRKYQNPYADD